MPPKPSYWKFSGIRAHLRTKRAALNIDSATIAKAMHILPAEFGPMEDGDVTPSVEQLVNWAIALGMRFNLLEDPSP